MHGNCDLIILSITASSVTSYIVWSTRGQRWMSSDVYHYTKLHNRPSDLSKCNDAWKPWRPGDSAQWSYVTIWFHRSGKVVPDSVYPKYCWTHSSAQIWLSLQNQENRHSRLLWVFYQIILAHCLNWPWPKIAPSLHPPFNITSNSMAPITWTVSLVSELAQCNRFPR